MRASFSTVLTLLLRAFPVAAGIFELLVPVRPAARRKIHQIPQRLDGADMPRPLAGIGRRIEQFRTPEVPDAPVAAALKDTQHRALLAVRVFTMIVALEG